MPKKGKGRGRGRGRGREQGKPGESIAPGKGEATCQRNEDAGSHHESQMAAASVATPTSSLDTTAKEDQGVCDAQSQLEQMEISDKNVSLPPGTVSINKSHKSTAEDLKQAPINQCAAAQSPSQQTHDQGGNRGKNHSVNLGSTTSATRSINCPGKSDVISRMQHPTHGHGIDDFGSQG